MSICLPVFNRPDLLRKSVDSINRLKGISWWHIYAQVEPSASTNESLDIIRSISNCASLSITVNQQIKGVLRNPIECIDSAIKDGADLVLYLEDDLEVSRDALLFVETASRSQDFDQVYAAGNLHFSGCSNNAHLTFCDQVCASVSNVAIRSQFLSSLGLFFTRSQYYSFIRPSWHRSPLKVRDLNGNIGAGWDYALTEALLERNNKTLQSIVPRVRHCGINGVHSTDESHNRGWHLAALWNSLDDMQEIKIVDTGNASLGDFAPLTIMAQQCWMLQRKWLIHEKRLQQNVALLKNLIL